MLNRKGPRMEPWTDKHWHTTSVSAVILRWFIRSSICHDETNLHVIQSLLPCHYNISVFSLPVIFIQSRQQSMTSCDLMLKLFQWVSSSGVHRFECGKKRALLWDQYSASADTLSWETGILIKRERVGPIHPFCYTSVIQLWKWHWCCSHHHNPGFTHVGYRWVFCRAESNMWRFKPLKFNSVWLPLVDVVEYSVVFAPKVFVQSFGVSCHCYKKTLQTQTKMKHTAVKTTSINPKKQHHTK